MSADAIKKLKQVIIASGIFFIFLAISNVKSLSATGSFEVLAPYTSIILSPKYTENITLDCSSETHCSAQWNGFGYYNVTFIGTTLGNITYSSTDFIGSTENISKSDFRMNVTKSPDYPSTQWSNSLTFASPIKIDSMTNNTVLLSNFWVKTNHPIPEGNYLAKLSIIITPS
jgi:hypothetical protein